MEKAKIAKDKILGAIYHKDHSIFRVWAPTKSQIDLLLYNHYNELMREKYPMKKTPDGIFSVTIYGDLHGKFYTYLVDNQFEISDPYSISTSVNSLKSAIIDLSLTNPEGFLTHKIPFNDKDRAIIYETHVKDYTGDISSHAKHRGKFLGLVDDTANFKGTTTGFRHLVDLGITHLHLMPVNDFLSVDEENVYFFNDDNYNWGYDPEHYNTVEGSYSTDPRNPVTRIFELKEMIMKLHEKGISVVLDVVYNHTYRSRDSNFNTLVPNYYYRLWDDFCFSNGTGCGNELATENEMVYHFLLNSLKYWMIEYKVDGFRFDLMALLDLESIEKIFVQLRGINPNVLLYGEPWMATDTKLPFNVRTLVGTQRNKGFAFFNSYFRDAIKGDNDGVTRGYIQGEFYLKVNIETGIAGSIEYDDRHKGFCAQANETINYFNSHDNLILFDKLKLTCDDEAEIAGRHSLAMAIIMTSLGIPFIHAGNEFLRSKNMVFNSYNSPLSINGIDWGLKRKYLKIFKYTKELISLRKKYDVFYMKDPSEIREKLKFVKHLSDDLIAYTFLLTNNRYLLIVHNASKEDREIPVNMVADHVKKEDTLDTKIRLIETFGKEGNVHRPLSDTTQFLLIGKISTEAYEIEVISERLL